MVTFRGMTEDADRLRRRIRMILGSRYTMNIGELCMRLGVENAVVRKELEAMMARGDVVRLRPVDYSREDQDFFRVNRPVAVSVKLDDKRTSQAWKERLYQERLAGEVLACLAD